MVDSFLSPPFLYAICSSIHPYPFNDRIARNVPGRRRQVMSSKHTLRPSYYVLEKPTLRASCMAMSDDVSCSPFPTATTPIHQLQPQRSGRHASVNHVDAIRHRFSSTAKRCRYAGNAMNELEHSLPESTYSRHPDLATRISPIQAIRHDPMANVAYK